MVSILSILLSYGGAIGGAWFLTTRFKETFPQYKGKILWTLFFFPLYYIIGMLIMGISPFFNSYNTFYSTGPTNLEIFTSVTVILLSIVSLLLFLKEWKLLKIIDLENLALIKKYANLTLIIAVVGIILAASMNFIQIVSAGGSFTGSLFIFLLIVGAIFYFTNKKIESFKRILMGENPAEVPTYSFAGMSSQAKSTPNHQQSKPESAKDKLYKLKELLDQGIITQEEFNSMKKEILEDWK